jgi:7,8-dihydro-6-hydroxymethylpterin dimethyltransferase
MTDIATQREVLLTETHALCPRCLQVLDAVAVERDGKVWLRRQCPDHGSVETLVLSDAAWWHWSRRFVRPGRAPAHAATAHRYGCPYDCGFCPDHQQHACVTVFEITEACNLTCPACFAGDAHVRHVSLEQVRGMAGGLLKAEGGQADVVMLSGGEPTLHPQFLEIADELRGLPIRYIIVNSNGVRFAQHPSFASQVAERDMLVYLQFDGFSPRTYRALRGREDLLDMKLRALENLAEAGARVVLVATVVGGLNDGEVGEIVRFGATHRGVRAVSLQPQFGEGRHVAFDPQDRVTLTDVIDAIGRDSGIFERDDFVPIPCCDPMCTAASYAWVSGEEVTPVTRMVPVETYLDYLENTAMPNLSEAFRADVAEMRGVLERLYSKSSPPGSQRQTEAFLCACGPLVDLDRVDDLPGEVFAVTIEGFMDRFNFDVSRVSRCCIQEALPDGRIVPFCAYNTLYRFAPDKRPVPGKLEPHAGHQPVQPVTIDSGVRRLE